ncbi:MAG: hypothetical protein ACRES3_05985, partial [Steroidobacteraceae bacterium]
GEGPAFAKPGAQAPQDLWVICRITVARPGRPLGSQEVVVYTAIMPRVLANDVVYRVAFGQFVAKTYGITGHDGDCATVKTEAGAQQTLDYLTTNKHYPSQIQVVKTGWQYTPQ